jgi:hypothetical protein
LESALAGNLERPTRNILFVLFGILVFVSPIVAQSTDLEFPTPVSSDQIAGRIRARDIGDSRLTTHYFVFETGMGDVLLNIETLNLNGDIDVYTAGSLKPLLKASVYALGYATAIQRQVYLRLPSRLILRVEGRTPNDDPAAYTIKFSGVFKPIAASAVPRDPGTPKVSGSQTAEGARARVSSVGTIIEEIRPPAPPVQSPKETPTTTTARNTGNKSNSPSNTSQAKQVAAKSPGSNNRAVVPVEPKGNIPTGASASRTSPAAAKNPTSAAKTNTSGKPKTNGTAAPAKNSPDPLAGVSLVLDMKDGSREKYSMTDVLRVNVDKTIVTIVLKNGEIHRLSLLDIAEMKIGQ